jgi:hypothetical protein
MDQGSGAIRAMNAANRSLFFASRQTCQSYSLTHCVNVYTFTSDMGRPRIAHDNRRSKLFPLRLSPRETAFFSRKARDLGESVASVLRKGGVLYIQMKSKDGSQKRKENKQ